MVKLNKIYTRTGDDGTTGLGTGERRLKSDLRVEAFGTVDEANSCIGLGAAAHRRRIRRSMRCSCAHPERPVRPRRRPRDPRHRRAARLRAAAHHRSARPSCVEADIDALNAEPQAAHILRPAGRLAGGRGASSGAHRRPAGRARHGGAGAGRGRTRDVRKASWLHQPGLGPPVRRRPASPTTTAARRAMGTRARTAELGRCATACSFRSMTPTA